MALLDPKLDVVFKMLFADEANRALLESLLTAVLRPSSPITRLSVLNPDLPKDLTTDRGVRLDVLVELSEGRVVDVEMECDSRRAHGSRWLYHWARLYAARLRRGDGFDRLEPVVCVVFLDAKGGNDRFHSIYQAREATDQSLLTDTLAVHVVQLPRLDRAAQEGESLELGRWARFLRLEDERALDSLATESDIMAQAKQALEILSREPSAQQIAEMRREAEIARRLDRAEDRAEGRAEGRVEGRAEGLRQAVRTYCSQRAIELDEPREARLRTANEAELEGMLEQLFSHANWPD